jgi:hypothetical protein
MARGNEWRDLRAVLWEQAWRQRDVASAFVLAQRIRTTRRSAEAAAVEDVAYELHDAEFRRLCAANGIEPADAAAVRARSRRRRG